MPGSHDLNPASEACSGLSCPRVVGTVRIEDVRAERTKELSEPHDANDISDALHPNWECRDADFRCFPFDRASRGADDGDCVSSFDLLEAFRDDSDLLTAPASALLCMDYSYASAIVRQMYTPGQGSCPGMVILLNDYIHIIASGKCFGKRERHHLWTVAVRNGKLDR